MLLIRKLGTKKDKKGKYRRQCIFHCPYCQKEVVRQLSSGKRQKSCGCCRVENIYL